MRCIDCTITLKFRGASTELLRNSFETGTDCRGPRGVIAPQLNSDRAAAHPIVPKLVRVAYYSTDNIFRHRQSVRFMFGGGSALAL